MQNVAIYGAGGLGEVVLDILQQGRRFRPCAFVDTNPALKGQVVAGLPVRGGPEELEALVREGIEGLIVAIGDNLTRVALAESIAARGIPLISAIHPLASISPSAELATHVVVGPRATVCVHARIGSHTVVLAGAIAEHDNVLGQGVFLDPAVRLAGGVTVEDFARVGIGASVIPGRRVGRGARVEPGAVVIHDVPPNQVVGGIPARPTNVSASRFVPSGG